MNDERETPTKKGESRRPSSRITTQYRAGRTMVYELECHGFPFDIRISESESVSGSWRAEAHNRFEAEATAVADTQPTPVEAVRKVAALWRANVSRLGLPELDWDQILLALGAVRAI